MSNYVQEIIDLVMQDANDEEITKWLNHYFVQRCKETVLDNSDQSLGAMVGRKTLLQKLYDMTPLEPGANSVYQVPLSGPVPGEVHDCATGLPVLDETTKGVKRGDTVSCVASGENVGESMIDEVLNGERSLFNAEEARESIVGPREQDKPPFVVTSSDPTIACFGEFGSLDEARLYVMKMWGCGLCLKGNIGCYRNSEFVKVEDFDKELMVKGLIDEVRGTSVKVWPVIDEAAHVPPGALEALDEEMKTESECGGCGTPVGGDEALRGLCERCEDAFEAMASLEDEYDLRTIVVACLGGVGAMSPEKYQITLETMAKSVGREVDDGFRAEVKTILESLPCPLN